MADKLTQMRMEIEGARAELEEFAAKALEGDTKAAHVAASNMLGHVWGACRAYNGLHDLKNGRDEMLSPN